MTKEQAIDAMKRGEAVVHESSTHTKYFINGEYVHKDTIGLRDILPLVEFEAMLKISKLETGWSIFPGEPKPQTPSDVGFFDESIQDLADEVNELRSEAESLQEKNDELAHHWMGASDEIDRLVSIINRALPAIGDGFPVVDEMRTVLAQYDSVEDFDYGGYHKTKLTKALMKIKERLEKRGDMQGTVAEITALLSGAKQEGK